MSLRIDTSEFASPVEAQESCVEQRRDSAFPQFDGYEKVGSALDTQSLMLATGEIGGQGFYNQFRITSSLGKLRLAKMKEACERVLEHCQILRVVFIQSGNTLFQAVKPYIRGVQVTTDGQPGNSLISTTTYLAHFHLIPDNNDVGSCAEVQLQIHHALYDAWSLGILFRELKAAYADEALSVLPDFLQWTSRMTTVAESSGEASTEYWKQLLHSSKMSFFAPKPVMLNAGILNSATIRIEVPLACLSTSYGTPANAFKAAWVLLLSHALGTDDVVFLEVNANRHDSEAESDAVCGPCATLLPVRARLGHDIGISALTKQLQDQYLASMSHQHVSIRSIVKDCTNWAPWSAFGSAVVFQNHRSLSPSLDFFDGVECKLSASGTSPELAQIWLMGMPTSETLVAEIAYSPSTIPPQQANWIAESLKFILNNLCTNLDRSVSELKSDLEEQAFGQYMTPVDVDDAKATRGIPAQKPSDEALIGVSKAWNEIGLKDSERQQDITLSDCGADPVTAYLLSEQLKKAGLLVEVADVVECPSQHQLGLLIDSKIIKGRGN